MVQAGGKEALLRTHSTERLIWRQGPVGAWRHLKNMIEIKSILNQFKYYYQLYFIWRIIYSVCFTLKVL